MSLTNASTSAGAGGRPVRSRLTRRASVRRSASGAGCKPAASSRARMKWSIGIARPGLVLHCGQRRTHRRDERPVRLILGPGGDPALQQLFLLRRERLVRGRRRHQLFGVVGQDPRRPVRSRPACPARWRRFRRRPRGDRAADRPCERRCRGRGRRSSSRPGSAESSRL